METPHRWGRVIKKEWSYVFVETLHEWDRNIKKEWSSVSERARSVLRTSILTAMAVAGTVAGIMEGWKTLKNYFVEFRHTDPDYINLVSQFSNGYRGWAKIIEDNRFIPWMHRGGSSSIMDGGIFSQREKLLSEKCDMHGWGWWNEDNDYYSSKTYFGELHNWVVDNVMCLRFRELALSILK